MTEKQTMKSYSAMIAWHVDQVENGNIRHYEWPSKMAIAVAYGVSEEQVHVDVDQEKQYREDRAREQRRAENKASNEDRRLTNIAKWRAHDND